MNNAERQAQRLENFRKLMQEFDQKPDDYDEGEEEDPRPYFAGEKPIDRFCCVTVNYTSHGEAKYFFLPTFGTAADARGRATEYAQDDVFEELPVQVVDLDRNTRSAPVYDMIGWTPCR